MTVDGGLLEGRKVLAKAPEKDRNPNLGLEPDPTDAFAEELAKRIRSIVPKGQSAQVVAQVVSLTKEERFAGPLPHPRHLQDYENIEPGTASRIIRMAEDALKHEQRLQETALKADVDDVRDGRRYGFLALSSLIAGALFCVWMGNDGIALAFLGAGALGTIGAFIKGRNGTLGSEKDER